ncbi:MAG: hypothetical protein EYC68_02400 [Chloroflexota bacterium]|nr:MAG: hypothetical protein EYC68_02400 [Chloroflexota bacterium]
MNSLHSLARQLFRFLVVWLVDGISLLFTAAIFPGIGFDGTRNIFAVAASAAFLLGIVNFLIRPVILLLALPFGFIAIFFVGFFLNAIALIITSNLLQGFYVNSWLDAFLGSLLLALFNTILTSVIAIDDDDSFYQAITERLAKRENFFALDAQTQGIIMMEIDGLSFHHIKKAIADGWMPTLKQMMEKQGYVLSRFDCGLPSQTSACQAGIMFGNNFDIPAFRWYDKDLGRLIVSGHDAPLINSRVATGSGLMREGSSVNNMMNGDARVSVLTLADLFQAPEEQQRRRAQDFYLVLLNPYFLLRTLVLYFGDIVRELYEATRQQIRREAPRLNRFAHFYPFIRAATTVLMRDISAALTTLDIVRGTPSLYVTWPGYDEVAHHSGPWTRDAFHTLRQYDHVIRRIRDTIEHKAPRPYELLILSDHGQSYGWTFQQRYGKSLKEFIEEHLPQGTNVTQSSGGDDGLTSVSAMASELDNMQAQNMGGRVGKRVIRGAKRVVHRGVKEGERANNRIIPSPNEKMSGVVVCGSGNLAQVYFDLAARRLTLQELNNAYPGVMDALVKHEGIGLVMAYNETGEPMVFGKKGARNLITNDVTGDDPLTLYGDANLRAAQLKRLAEFPHNGDLTIISTFYPDGTVAAMEELVGNHGGFGGEQTDAFIFHPQTFSIPETSNSADVFHILNARRGVIPEKIEAAATPVLRARDAWSLSVLWRGLRRVSTWLPLAARSIVLDRSAFRQSAFNPYMTAPAVLIALLTSLLAAWIARGEFNVVEWLTRFAAWLVGTLFVFAAARLLRGKADFTTTLRATGFAQSGYVIELFALIEPLAALARSAAFLLVILATWFAASEAHKLRGWRTLLLPVVVLLIALASAFILNILINSTQITLDSLMGAFGLQPR